MFPLTLLRQGTPVVSNIISPIIQQHKELFISFYLRFEKNPGWLAHLWLFHQIQSP